MMHLASYRRQIRTTAMHFWTVVKQQFGYAIIAAIDKYDAGVECTEIRSLQSALLEDVRS